MTAEIMLYPLVFMLLLVPVITIGAAVIALVRLLAGLLRRQSD